VKYLNNLSLGHSADEIANVYECGEHGRKKNHGLLEGLLAYTLPQTVDEKCNTVTQTSDAHSIFVAILNQTFWCSTRSKK